MSRAPSRAGIEPSGGYLSTWLPARRSSTTPLRAFTLGAFAYLLRELDDAGESLPFAFEEHVGRDGPALYEYRPLVRDFVEARAPRLRGRDDA